MSANLSGAFVWTQKPSVELRAKLPTLGDSEFWRNFDARQRARIDGAAYEQRREAHGAIVWPSVAGWLIAIMFALLAMWLVAQGGGAQ